MNEAKALTLEAGKYYRTRDGRKAFVSGTNPFSEGSHIRAIGVVYGNGVQGWDLSGAFSSLGGHGLDLVDEWVEPKRIKGWLNVYPENDESFDIVKYHPTREQADVSALSTRIACIKIDVLEGEGLNGEVA
ncbi:hypothetical protein [Rhizobium sp. Nf11,1]|uniref:hypothetical protein n=1 Tax=Rhizobium sp. Nf11,1 TaxID=3404923 RepID=UPI003D3504CA